MPTENQRTVPLASGPSLARFLWMRLLVNLNIMPRVTVTLRPTDSTKSGAKVTYLVYHTFWMGNPYRRAFYGLRCKIRNGGVVQLAGYHWSRATCDRVEYDTLTKRGEVEFRTEVPTL